MTTQAETTQLQVKIPNALKAKAIKKAKAEDLDISKVVRRFLRDYVAE
jgi:antitoxin component of RelBE/YafQ-DinJ toxin-antitoxin module